MKVEDLLLKTRQKKEEAELAEQRAREAEENESKLRTAYDRIKKLQEVRQALDAFIHEMEVGYSGLATHAEPLETKRQAMRKGRLGKNEARQFIEGKIAQLGETLKEVGITDLDTYLQVSGTLEEPLERTTQYREAEQQMTSAFSEASGLRKIAKPKVRQLRNKKKEAVNLEAIRTDGAADKRIIDLLKTNGPAGLAELRKRGARLGQEIEKLELQTPEGRSAAKEKLEAEFKERFSGREFFTESYKAPGRGVDLVAPEDLALAGKYGPEMVRGALSAQIEAKLKQEVDEAKNKAGILSAKTEMSGIESLPDKYGEFTQRIEQLAQKRENLCRELGDKGKGRIAMVKLFFGSGRNHHFENFLEKDFARAWLFHTEKDVFFKQYFSQGYGWDDNEAERGLPFILARFLQKKIVAIESLRRQTNGGLNRTDGIIKDLFDSEAFGKNLELYDKFLTEFETIVQNQPEAIAISFGSNRKSDRDILHEKFGYHTDSQPVFQNLSIKNKTIREGLESGKSLEQIKAELAKLEEPFNLAHEERKRFLADRLEAQWAAQELERFKGLHPNIDQLLIDQQIDQAQKENSAGLTESVASIKLALESGESSLTEAFKPAAAEMKSGKPEQRAEEFMAEFELIVGVSNGRQPEKKVILTLAHGQELVLSGKLETSGEELKTASRLVRENDGKKRSWHLLGGKDKLDVELEKLQAEEAIAKAENDKAGRQLQAYAEVKKDLELKLGTMAENLTQGKFSATPRRTNITDFLEGVEFLVEQAARKQFKAEDSASIEVYKNLKRVASEKGKKAAANYTNFSSEVREKLIRAGWRE